MFPTTQKRPIVMPRLIQHVARVRTLSCYRSTRSSSSTFQQGLASPRLRISLFTAWSSTHGGSDQKRHQDCGSSSRLASQHLPRCPRVYSCLRRVVRLARCAFTLRPSGGVSNYVLAITHYCLCTQNIGSILRYYKPALWLHECRGGLSTIRAPMPPRAACPRTRPQIPWRAPHDHLVAT